MKESMNLKDSKKSSVLTSIFIDDLSNKIGLEETFYSISKQTYLPDLLVLYSNLSVDQINELKGMLDNPKIILRKKDKDDKPIEEIIESDAKINYSIVETKSDNFAKLFNETFNMAIENEYDLFSMVEVNDIVGLHWFNYVNEYYKENENVDVFFPIIRNTVNGVFAGLLNEAPWAEGLAEEAGKLDLNLLSRFNCITPLGAAFKISSLKEYSQKKEDERYYPFKESIKLSHYYEFFMRMVYNDIKAICIPRVGYEFRTKTNDFFKCTGCKIPQNITQIPIENGGISQEEGQFWMELAKKEYFFDEDRNKTYEKSKL